MDKTYNPKDIEARWAHYWETHHLSKPTGPGKPYCMMLPPPNVTGTLHMGHGFQQTLMDTLIRHKRMQGYKTLWQGGTDHAGIATQMVVEQQLAQEGLSRSDFTREQFIKRVWLWREQYGSIITQQMRRLGVSLDWTRERFSMDEGLSHATQTAFVTLYREGLIYRGQKLVNWDMSLKTAISDLEVETEQVTGEIWFIRYPLTDGSGQVTVATTRPETLLGDVALAVHPEDPRYQSLIGKTVQLPLCSRTIPIIADNTIDREFGTGCVKITPAHDFNDYAIGKRHALPLINILTPDGHLNTTVPAIYQGLDRFIARKKIIADLKQYNLLEKSEPHQLSIPRGEKSGSIIEPFLTDQWFLKTSSLREPAIKAVKTGQLKFVPQHWEKTYLQWLENIEDWCISRQLWWGHVLPVWTDDQKNNYVGYSEQEVRQYYHLPATLTLHPETEVLDTWFSASLWPFAALGWPLKTEAFKTFYPTQILVTGFDIIFFWVARMVMMGLKFTGKVPFQEVYITGLIRDSEGKKMSKSKGNILDPVDLIDGIDLAALIHKRTHALLQPKMAKTIETRTRKEFPNGITAYGTDALRFTYCALATQGRDINFDMGRIEGYRNFCNKLWNAARFVLMHVEAQAFHPTSPVSYSLADHWIRSRFQKTIQQVEAAFAAYRFDWLAQVLYEFIWHEFCDWYLEFAKCVLTHKNADKNISSASIRGACFTLLEILEALLRLAHPIMPFITEEIWQTVKIPLGKTGQTIMTEPYPHYHEKEIDLHAEAEIEWIKQIVTATRTMRSEMGLSPAALITVIFSKGSDKDVKRLTQHQYYIEFLTKSEKAYFSSREEKIPTATATHIINQLEIHIPLAGLVNKQIELARLEKEIHKLEKDYQKLGQLLQNENYLKKAPADIIEKERKNFSQIERIIQKLRAQHTRISHADF